MYFGTLVWSDVPHSRITEIKYPPLDDRFVLIKAEDIPGDNRLTILNGTLPILSNERLSHVHQPILAIFGPDYESVTIAARETEITYEEDKEVDETPSLISDLPDPLLLSWGEEKEKDESYKCISTTYTSTRIESPSSLLITCNAWYDGGKIHIEVPTQWPSLIKRTVASAMAFPESNVIVHQLPCESRHDDYLIMPAILSAITAAAVMKTGISAEMKVLSFNTSPQITVERSTWCKEDGKPESEEVVMSIDQGAFPIASEELQRQAISGLIPNYPLEEFKAKVLITTSYQPPSSFFGTLGYAEALASSEYHATEIATALGVNPKQWKSMVMNGKRKFTDYIPSIDFTPLTTLSTEVAKQSDFDRKWYSYDSQKGDMSLIPFARGIGLATGISISGFSSHFSKNADFHAKITLTEKNNLTLNTSFQASDNTASIYRKLITQEMDLSDDNDVIILDKDSNLIDSGPDVLRRSIGKFPKQLIAGCRRILLKKKKEKPPISEIIDTDDRLSPCEFDASGSMSLVVEVRTDNITFAPTVEEVWASITVGHIYNETQFRAKIAECILTSLSEAGATFNNDSLKPFTIHITLHEDNTETIASLEEAANALAKAAFASALKQCANKLTIVYPVSAEKLENAINSKGGEKNT